MKKTQTKIAVFCFVAVTVAAMIQLSDFSSPPPKIVVGNPPQQRLVPVQLSSAPDDPDVCCSILDGAKLSIEVQPQWAQDREFLLQVNVVKPVGTAYFVNPVENSYILFVNNHPWATPTTLEADNHAQRLLNASIGSHHPSLRLPLGIPIGAEVVLEWVNYNLRTEQLERLRTAPITIRKAG